MGTIALSGLFVYPLKSARGVALDVAVVVARGLEGDRRWMVVDRDGEFISQRTHPRLALVSALLEGGRLALAAPGAPTLVVDPPSVDEPSVRVRVWDDVCDALPAGPEPARWLSARLGIACELVFLPDGSHRPVAPASGVTAAEVSFADAYPFLLISEASLEDLNRRLASPVPMDRFRPNLVVRGCEPYAEDGWRRIRVGPVAFRVVKPCSRCGTIVVDQTTGVRGREPLATLATYRRVGSEVMFGQNLVHEGTGPLHLGDEVTVLEPR